MLGSLLAGRWQSEVADRVGGGRFNWEPTPLLGSLLYLALGIVALFLSDVVFVVFLPEPVLSQVQAIKGGVEVLLTTGLVYWLLATSRARLTDANEALTRRQEELKVLHRVFRHNLRNSLNVIEGFAQLLESRIGSEPERMMCRRIAEECDDLIRYTEQAARIRKISTRDEPFVTVDLAVRIPDVVANHEFVDGGASVRTDLPDRARVRANPMIDEAIAELVTNAVVHGDASTIEVSVVPGATPDGKTRIEVRDDGRGVPEHVQRVFGGSGEGPESDQLVHLDGLGLWFVYLTAVASGGELTVDADERGTVVRLWLPGAGPG